MRVLMCRPTYFEIAYEINPWMHIDNKVDQKLAHEQWQSVYDAYRDAGVQIELIDPVSGFPDMVFTANGAVVKGNTCIISNHRYKERKGEEFYFNKWFAGHGYEIFTLNHHQSGEGDALFFRDTLYMGWGFRSERQSHDEIKKILGVETVSLKLINPYFYDFDTAFCPIGDKAILYYPDAFDEEGKTFLEKMPHAIALDSKEANSFDCNSVFVGDTLFVEYVDDHLKNELQKIGVKVRLFDMSEYKKSGGGIKCITLLLER